MSMTTTAVDHQLDSSEPATSEYLPHRHGRWRAETKSPAMMLTVLVTYILCSLVFTPRLFVLLEESTWWVSRVAVVTFILMIQVFWLYGWFYLIQGAYSFYAWLLPYPAPPRLKTKPRVAILYTTLHDFQERAVLSCIRQDYPHTHTFILDDSRDEQFKSQVDEFAARYPDNVTVVRRPDRNGYKAGNINNALANHVTGYEYFALADADSIFPPNFIADLLPHFGGDNGVGFVQAAFRPDPTPKTSFARDLGIQIHCMWSVYCRARNRFGSVIFLGHGGILRYDVWQKIGGFPTIISEDLAFSHRAARLGYRGRYVLDVYSYEEFPDSYVPFRKQQNRYVQGVCQYLHLEYWGYLCSNKVTWAEKLDTLLTCGSLLMPFFFLAFLVLYCVLMPVLFGVDNIFAFDVAGYEIQLPVMLLSQRFYDLSFSPDYFLLTLACTLSPSLGIVPLMLRHPIAAPRMLMLAAGPYMSLLVCSSTAILSYLLFRTAVFTATGDRSAMKVADRPKLSPRWQRLWSQDSLNAVLEVTAGTILMYLCILTLNLTLLGFAVAIALAPILLRTRWDSFLLRPLLYMPYLLLIAGLLLGTAGLLQGSGMLMPSSMFRF